MDICEDAEMIEISANDIASRITADDIREYQDIVMDAPEVTCPIECAFMVKFDVGRLGRLSTKKIGPIYHEWQNWAVKFALQNRFENMYYCINQAVMMRRHVMARFGDNDAGHAQYLAQLFNLSEYLRHYIVGNYTVANDYVVMSLYELTYRSDIRNMIQAANY